MEETQLVQGLISQGKYAISQLAEIVPELPPPGSFVVASNKFDELFDILKDADENNTPIVTLEMTSSEDPRYSVVYVIQITNGQKNIEQALVLRYLNDETQEFNFQKREWVRSSVNDIRPEYLKDLTGDIDEIVVSAIMNRTLDAMLSNLLGATHEIPGISSDMIFIPITISLDSMLKSVIHMIQNKQKHAYFSVEFGSPDGKYLCVVHTRIDIDNPDLFDRKDDTIPGGGCVFTNVLFKADKGKMYIYNGQEEKWIPVADSFPPPIPDSEL